MLFPVLMLSFLTITSVSSLDKLTASLQLADDIVKKQEECETYFEANPEALDEGNDMFPNIPNQEYFNCYKSLDNMKNTYIKNNLLGLSFYDALFPMRLSNGDLVFVPLPLERESTEIPIDFSEYSVLQEICKINKTCQRFKDHMTSSVSLVDTSYYLYFKEKFFHCVGLLDELKLKFIRDHNLNLDLLKIVDNLPILCDKEFVSMPLPESFKDDEVSSDSNAYESHQESSIVSSKSSSASSMLESQAARTKVELGIESVSDKNQTSSYINSIPFTSKSKQVEVVHNDSKLNKVETEREINDKTVLVITPEERTSEDNSSTAKILDTSTSSFGEDNINPKPIIDPENGDTSSVPKESKNNETEIEIVSVRIVNPESNNDNVSDTIISTDMYSDPVRSPHDNVLKGLSGDISENLPQKSERSEETPYSDQYNIPLDSPLHVRQQPMDHIITATPSPDTEGNEIAQLEDDCNELIQMANKLLESQSFDRLSHVDEDHAWCMYKLNVLKRQYIERHNIDVSGHKSVFPVVLSSGVQWLVLLPPPHPRPPSVSHEPSQQLPGDMFREGAEPDDFTDLQRRASYRHRVMVENPAFISNEMFFEYLSQTNKPAEESTLSKLANMIHRNVGHSDRTTDDEYLLQEFR